MTKYIQGRMLGVKMLRKIMSKKFIEKENPEVGIYSWNLKPRAPEDNSKEQREGLSMG